MSPALKRSVGVVLMTVTAIACSGSSNQAEVPRSEVAHVHGLGVDPQDPDALYLATHLGMFRLSDGRVERRGELFQDTMGFAVTEDGRLLGSGHPDLRDDSIIDGDMAPHLGLIESTDGAATWQPLSLQGEADLHVIQASGDLVYGYDATDGSLLVTEDLLRWTTRDRLLLTSLAVSPQDPDRLVATNGRGTVIASTDQGRTWAAVDGAPQLTQVSWAEDGTIGGIGPDGTFWASVEGRRFQQGGHVSGVPAALLLGPSEWYAATDVAVYASDDAGRSWTTILELG